MQIEKYLEKHQPVIYQTFVNSLKKKTLSHAFLLCGNPGTPLLEVAKFLAKSIICDDPSPLACNNCITCLRVDDENYPDFMVYDGSKQVIKKKDVGDIESRFEKKAFESKGIMIYILHLVENMTIEAVNSILKFLEEPDTETYAFLTTNNESNILPTIVSRCQVLHLKQIDRQEVIENAVSFGVPRDDAELLSYFYNDGELIFEVLETKETRRKSSDPNEKEKIEEFNKEVEEHNENKAIYLYTKELLLNYLEALSNDDNREAIYYFQTNVIPNIKTKESIRYFLDMLSQIYEDILNLQNGRDIILESYGTILDTLSKKLTHVENDIVEILKARNTLNLNVNPSLLLDHLIITIAKD